MGRKRYSANQIIVMLREAEAAKKVGVSEQTLVHWKKEYSGLRVDQAKRLKDLERENARIKRLVADLSLDNSIFKDVSLGNL